MPERAMLREYFAEMRQVAEAAAGSYERAAESFSDPDAQEKLTPPSVCPEVSSTAHEVSPSGSESPGRISLSGGGEVMGIPKGAERFACGSESMSASPAGQSTVATGKRCTSSDGRFRPTQSSLPPI